MPIYKTPYDTTACRGFKTAVDKISHAVATQAILGYEMQPLTDARLVLVAGGRMVDEVVSAFAHPMLIELPGGHYGPKGDYIAQDVRPLVKFDPQTGISAPRNKLEYDATVLRGRLTALWVNGNVDALKSLSDLPLMVYANWIGESVAKRMNLDPRDQLSLSILGGIFYLSLFQPDDFEPDDAWKSYLSSKISRAVGYPSDAVFDVVKEFNYIRNVDELCTVAKEYTGSIRLRDLNAAVLFTIIGGYWYGNNGRETICTALEHPPTWLALIYQGFHDRGYRNTNLAKILERGSYKKHTQQYTLQLLGLADPSRH